MLDPIIFTYVDCKRSRISILVGKPMIMSSPHFYVPEGAGDTGFNASLIHGIDPIKESHETFLDISPV